MGLICKREKPIPLPASPLKGEEYLSTCTGYVVLYMLPHTRPPRMSMRFS